MTTPNNQEPPPKDVRKEFLMDEDLALQAEQKAKQMGWSLGSVVRALLRLWVQEDVISSKDVGSESTPAPKKQRRKKKKDLRK